MTSRDRSGIGVLSDAAAKLYWGNRHLEFLLLEIQRYHRSLPVREERRRDPATRDLLIYAVIDRDPDDDVALVLGDMVHALRSALDQAIHALVRTYGTVELTDREWKSICFPVCRSTESWRSEHAKALRGLPDSLVEVVRSLQPFATAAVGRDSAVEPIAALHEMWNHDKHRRLLLTARWNSPSPDVIAVTQGEDVPGTRWIDAVEERGSRVLVVPAAAEGTTELLTFFDREALLQPVWNRGAEGLFHSSLEELAMEMVDSVEAALRALADWMPVERVEATRRGRRREIYLGGSLHER